MRDTQTIFQFTLILKNVDDQTLELEDSLYEAGCDDALINYRSGTVYLDFDRKTLSLEEAVMSAIKQVESSSVGAIVAGVAPESLVTESEIAKRLSVKKQAVSLWIKGQRRVSTPFPSPKLRLSNKSPLWKWSEIAEWAVSNRIVKQSTIIDEAMFIEDINAALEERNTKTNQHRQMLVKRLSANTGSSTYHSEGIY